MIPNLIRMIFKSIPIQNKLEVCKEGSSTLEGDFFLFQPIHLFLLLYYST